MERAEKLIMEHKINVPTCILTLTSKDARVVLEQSLELTWSGDLQGCRELIRFMFPPGTNNVNEEFLNSGKLDMRDGYVTFVADDGAHKAEFQVYGSELQASYLMAAFIKAGGLYYFDKAVTDRRSFQ